MILLLLDAIPALSYTYGSAIKYKSLGLQTINQVPANRSITTNSPNSARSPEIWLFNPPLRICGTRPGEQSYSDTAIYTIAGIGTLGKVYGNQSTLRYLGGATQNVTIIMTNNMTKPLSGNLVVNNESMDLQVQHITTQCGSKFTPGMNSSALRSPYPNPRVQDLVLSNPPLRMCIEPVDSALYMIKAVTENGLPNGFPTGKQNVTITLTNHLLTGEILGKVLLNDGKSMDLQISEIDTICSHEAF